MTAHWHKAAPRQFLIEDINEWIKKVTKGQSNGIPEDTRLSRKELDILCFAIDCAEKA